LAPDQRPPETLRDPGLFDTEALIKELDRCRELVLLIPARTHDVHFATNNAIGAIWNLREQVRYLLAIHREGQRQWQNRAASLSDRQKPNPGRQAGARTANATRGH